MRATGFVRWVAVVQLAALLAGRAVAAEPRPGLAAILAGDSALVKAVGGELGRRGVRLAPASAGDAIRVSLERRDGGIVVGLRDRYGRSAVRVVATEATAATLIESWTHGEYAEAPPPPPAPALPAPRAAAPTIVAAAPVPPDPTPLLVSLRLAGETVTDGARSRWLAATPGLCGRVGPACFGVEARFAWRMDHEGGHFRHGFHEEREPAYDVQGLLSAELAIPLGRPRLLLGLGAGVGRRSEEGRANVGVRSEARLGLIVPIWSELAFDAGLVATLAGEGRRWAVESEGLFRFGLGLRWGLW